MTPTVTVTVTPNLDLQSHLYLPKIPGGSTICKGYSEIAWQEIHEFGLFGFGSSPNAS